MLLKFYDFSRNRTGNSSGFEFGKKLTYTNGCEYEARIYYELQTIYCLFFSEFEIHNYDERKGSSIFHLNLPFKGCYDLYEGRLFNQIYVLF
jgi:hypothetical protein